MKLYLLAVVAVVSIASLNSCKKKTPEYCANEFFGEISLTDDDGAAQTEFSLGEDIHFNIDFTNNSGDSLRVNYTDPWVEYEITSGGQFVATSAPFIPETGLSTRAMANNEVHTDSFEYTSSLVPGTYSVTARCYFEVMGCNAGLRITEKTKEFKVVQ
jgi:hypothetical protein